MPVRHGGCFAFSQSLSWRFFRDKAHHRSLAEPAHLTSRLEQLLLMRDGQTVGSIPCEDIGVVVVDQQQTTYTHSALSTLAQSDAVLVVCGRDHLPVGVLLPLADHTQVVWRINEQIGISRPLRKRLWKQLIREKIPRKR